MSDLQYDSATGSLLYDSVSGDMTKECCCDCATKPELTEMLQFDPDYTPEGGVICVSATTSHFSITTDSFKFLKTNTIELQVSYAGGSWVSVDTRTVTYSLVEQTFTYYAFDIADPAGGWDDETCEGTEVTFRHILRNTVCPAYSEIVDVYGSWFVFVRETSATPTLTATIDEFCYEEDDVTDPVVIDWTASSSVKFISIYVRCEDYTAESNWYLIDRIDIACEGGSGTYYWYIPSGFEMPDPPTGGCITGAEGASFRILIDAESDDFCAGTAVPDPGLSHTFLIGTSEGPCPLNDLCGFSTSGTDGTTIITFDDIEFLADCTVYFAFEPFAVCDRLVVTLTPDGGSLTTPIDTGCIGSASCPGGNPSGPWSFTVVTPGIYTVVVTVYGDCDTGSGGTAWSLDVTCSGDCYP